MNFFGKEMKKLANDIDNVDVGFDVESTRTTYANAQTINDDGTVNGNPQKLYKDWPNTVTVEFEVDGEVVSIECLLVEQDDSYAYWESTYAPVGVAVEQDYDSGEWQMFIEGSNTLPPHFLGVFGPTTTTTTTTEAFRSASAEATGISREHTQIIETTPSYFYDVGSGDVGRLFECDLFNLEEPPLFLMSALGNKYINNETLPSFTLDIDGHQFTMEEYDRSQETQSPEPYWCWRCVVNDDVENFPEEGTTMMGTSTITLECFDANEVLIMIDYAFELGAFPLPFEATVQAYKDEASVEDDVVETIANKIGNTGGGAYVARFQTGSYIEHNTYNGECDMSYQQIIDLLESGENVIAQFEGHLTTMVYGGGQKVVVAEEASADFTYVRWSNFYSGYTICNAHIALNEGNIVIDFIESSPIKLEEISA